MSSVVRRRVTRSKVCYTVPEGVLNEERSLYLPLCGARVSLR
jgi:hypothetical protein